MIIEDEKDQPLHLLIEIPPGGGPETKPLDCGQKLDDLEGITSIGNTFYVTGSHHPKEDGSRRKKREHFSSLQVSGTKCSTSGSAPSLQPEIRRVLERNGLAPNPLLINIEALARDPGSDRIYVALRQPVVNGNSILLALLNPNGIFERDEPPRFSDEVIQLPIGGGGVRALSYVDSLGGYLVTNETPSKKGKMKSRLWYWPGPTRKPVQIKTDGLKELKNIEGITPYRIGNKEFILAVCDDGNRKKGKGGRFALLPLADIKKAIPR